MQPYAVSGAGGNGSRSGCVCPTPSDDRDLVAPCSTVLGQRCREVRSGAEIGQVELVDDRQAHTLWSGLAAKTPRVKPPFTGRPIAKPPTGL
jgi:hypothetical protein